MTSFVALDVETANAELASICQVGFAEIREGRVRDAGAWFVQLPEGMEFDPNNVRIHGIDQGMIADAPGIAEVWNKLQPRLQSLPAVAHNADFDTQALRSALDQAGVAVPDVTFFCSVQISRKMWPHLENHKLGSVAAYLNIPLQHHEAASDAMAAGQIVVEACRKAGVSCLYELADKINVSCKSLREAKSGGRLFPNERVRVRDLKPRTAGVLDSSHPLYGRCVTFTGNLRSMTRQEAMQRVVDLGGRPMTVVGKKTNLLVIGWQDPGMVSGGQSSKMRAALSARAKGRDLKILDEQQFLTLLDA